jgi:DDE family transposase
MTSPEMSSILSLYQRTASSGVLEYLEKQTKMRRKGIYTLAVVFWLMILQRLQKSASQASMVQQLAQGAAAPLLVHCKRVREKKISLRTGGYCQARQRMPKLLARQVSETILERLRAELSEPWPGLERPIFLLDGSTLELEHCRELLRAYPPGTNGRSQGHWPVLQIVVMHDASSGLAQAPCWGPMYGPQAVSEQALAEAAMEQLPDEAVVMADCNFGIFSTGYSAQQRQHPVVLRLTQVRARKLAGQAISRAGEQAVAWKPSRQDKPKQTSWPADASLAGRLIAGQVGRGKSKQWLYLFTTLALPWREIIELYRQRWTIETDLRSLKRTVRLQHIAARSGEMMEKELLIAVSAYNLVRAVMCLAARRAKLHPRQLSFSFVLTLVDCSWPRLVHARTQAEHDREFERVLDLAVGYHLPKRPKHRSYPRAAWGHGGRFPRRLAPPITPELEDKTK